MERKYLLNEVHGRAVVGSALDIRSRFTPMPGHIDCLHPCVALVIQGIEQ